MELLNFREKIDTIDKEILDLILKRMDISNDVAKFKIQNDIGILDVTRENEVINSRFEYLKSLGIEDIEFINALFGIILIKSKQIQGNLLDEIEHNSI